MNAVEQCTYLHKTKPWIPNYLRTLIAPLRVRTLYDRKWFDGEPLYKYDGLVFFTPSDYFWQRHAETSHPVHGRGCDTDKHVAFLTEGESNEEFVYMIQLKDLTFYIADSSTFEEECHSWEQNWK